MDLEEVEAWLAEGRIYSQYRGGKLLLRPGEGDPPSLKLIGNARM